MTEPESLTHAREYIEHGWSLCAIRPQSKQAYGSRWQEFGRDVTHWEQCPDDGMGLIHGLSGTCSLDLDNLEAARIALAAVGVDLTALLAAPDAVRLIGAPGRGKLVYRTSETLSRTALNWPDPETGKSRAVLELRAGAVQDVLPPSIHPDTGAPYRWEGDWRALPELPGELLGVWQYWPEAKRAMEAACPWNDTPAISEGRYEGVERRRYAEGESVIAEFNAAHDVRAVLESFGYRRAGPRLISPHSESGLPGVVVLPGSEGRLVYVHHASDPLCDGHAHDAFSVWCQIEHHGDVARAVKAAAEILGIAHSQTQSGDADEGAGIAARIQPPRIYPPPERPRMETHDTPDPPTDPIPIPALADLEHWLRMRHWGAKRVATVQGALAFAAAMTARRYVTTERQPTNVMLGVVDTSVAGLMPMRGALYEAADTGGEQPIIRGEGVASAATLHRALLRTPRMFWVSADYGYMVSMYRKQTSGAYRSALDVVQEVYEGAALYLSPETIGIGKDTPISECKIYAPGLAALILASEDQMRDIAQRSQYGRGAVQQILFARAVGSPGDEAGSRPGASVPGSVIETMKALRGTEQRSLGGLNSRAAHPPILATVELGPGAADAFEEIRAALGVLFHDERLIVWRGVAKGALVTAKRLAAALGAWSDPEAPVLTADVVRWVGAWVVHHVARSVEWYDVIATEDGEPSLLQDIRRIIFDAGPAGIKVGDIKAHSRAWRATTSEKRREVLDQLLEDGYCVERPSAGGRTTLYVDSSYITPAPSPTNA